MSEQIAAAGEVIAHLPQTGRRCKLIPFDRSSANHLKAAHYARGVRPRPHSTDCGPVACLRFLTSIAACSTRHSALPASSATVPGVDGHEGFRVRTIRHSLPRKTRRRTLQFPLWQPLRLPIARRQRPPTDRAYNLLPCVPQCGISSWA